MSRARTFKKADLQRAIETARTAQFDLKAVEITKAGAIRLIPGTPSDPQPNPWDKVLADDAG